MRRLLRRNTGSPGRRSEELLGVALVALGMVLGALPLTAFAVSASASASPGTSPCCAANSPAAAPTGPLSSGPAPVVPAGLQPTVTEWANISASVARDQPPPLTGASMVYDPLGQFLLLFGGLAPWGPTDDTWAGYGFPGAPSPGFFWVNLTGQIALPPPPRYHAAMTFDPNLGGVLLFGGQYAGGNQTFGDTWLFTGSAVDPAWTLLPAVSHPSPRAGAQLTYDPVDGYDVLFGGYNDPNYYGDTWTFSGGTWTYHREAVAPYPRAFGGFVFDDSFGSALLTTGDGGATDLWYYVHGNWTLLLGGSALGDRLLQGVVYNSNTTDITFFGGENVSLANDFGDTWNFSSYLAFFRLTTSGPTARAGIAMAYDPFMGFTVLYGGGSSTTGAFFNDTWIFGTWPLSAAPFSVGLVANPAPSLHPVVQPGNLAAFTVNPAGGTWPYHIRLTLIGPLASTQTTDDQYVNGPYSTSFAFTTPASYEVRAVVTAADGLSGSVNLTYPVGTIVLPNWQPIRDAYSFANYGGTWASGGNCWGFSTTALLYWEHDLEGLAGTPYLPSAAWATVALGEPPPAGNPGLNGTTLSIMVHQTMDPANDVRQGGGFGQGQMAANYATILGNLAAGKPSLLDLQSTVGYHAVIAYGVYTLPGTNIVEILVSDPNSPMNTLLATYNPSAETFLLNDGINWTAFEVPNSPLPSTVQPSWVAPIHWGNSQWYDANGNGYYFVVGFVPLTVHSSFGGTDSFSDWSGANSQSFVAGIPASAGIEEPYTYLVNGQSVPGSVQVFAINNTPQAHFTISDPSPESLPLQVLLAQNDAGTPTVRGFDLNVSSAGTHHYSVVPGPSGATVRIGSVPVEVNLSFGQLVGGSLDALNATALSFPGDSIVTFEVRNWSALNATGAPPVRVTVATENGSGPTTQYTLVDGQAGLGVGVSLDHAVTFTETGLPAGKRWTVALNGTVESSTGPTIVFNETNGSYPYLIAGPAGHRVGGLPSTGTIDVTGGPVTVPLSFAKGPTYRLTFAEKGLARGQSWCAAVEGWERCSTHRTDPFANLTPGSYAYSVVSPTGGQTITAKIGPSPVPIAGPLNLTHGTRLKFSFVYPYPLTFTESGLASGNWSVTVHGQTLSAPAGTPIAFELPNGSYSYRVGAELGYRHSGSPRTAHLAGAPASVAITFAPKLGAEPARTVVAPVVARPRD